MTTEIEWVPTSCTLPTAEQPLRVAEFDALFADSLTRVERDDADRALLTLSGRPGTADRARALAEQETSCCSFFDFAVDALEVREDTEQVRMTIAVPPAHRGVLDGLVARAESLAVVPTDGP